MRVRFCMYVLVRRQTLVYVHLISSAEGARAAVVGPICLAAKPLVCNIKQLKDDVKLLIEWRRHTIERRRRESSGRPTYMPSGEAASI